MVHQHNSLLQELHNESHTEPVLHIIVDLMLLTGIEPKWCTYTIPVRGMDPPVMS